MAMRIIPLPSSTARNPLARVGLLLLWSTLGCRLGEADVVRRLPDLNAGGGDGLDAQSGDSLATDTASTSLPYLDGGGVAADVVEKRDAETEAGSSADATVDKNLGSDDTANQPSDTGVRAEVSAPCGSKGFVFCDGFQSGVDLWVATGGAWDIVSDPDDPSAQNLVFGPTNAVASIASVPSVLWRDMTVEAKVMVTSFKNASATNRVVVYARYQDVSHFYAIALRGDGKLDLRRNANVFGTTANVSIAENEWHTLQIRVSGPADNVVVEGSLDGVLLAAATDTDGSLPSDTGTVGVGVYGGALAVFDDVRVSSP